MFLKPNPDGSVVYPYAFWQMKRDFPYTSFTLPLRAEDLIGIGIFEPVETPMPAFDLATHRAVEVDPALVDGVWTQQWLVRPLTQAELDANAAHEAAQALEQADEQAKQTAKGDPVLQFLLTHTPAEIIAKVNAEVTSIASARSYIGKLAVAVRVLAKKELR